MLLQWNQISSELWKATSGKLTYRVEWIEEAGSWRLEVIDGKYRIPGFEHCTMPMLETLAYTKKAHEAIQAAQNDFDQRLPHNVPSQIAHTEAVKGEMVTVWGDGSIGQGYLTSIGEVFKPTGSYWAVNARFDVQPMVRFARDGGQGYRETARRLTGY